MSRAKGKGREEELVGCRASHLLPCAFWKALPLQRPISYMGTVSQERRPCNGGGVVPRELNVLALLKGNERYVFVYDDESRPLLIDLFRDQAADPRLSFNWFDAAVMTDRAREQGRQSQEAMLLSRPRI
jgi:hypothetical protein